MSFAALHEVLPSATLDDLRQAEGDLDQLAAMIAEQVEQPCEEVRRRLDAIITR